MSIGTIVGAGVFGTIPAAANLVGTGVEWAYLLAFVSIIVCYMPQMVTISVLPSPFAYYMHATRLVGPKIGYMMVIFGFNYVFLLSALASVFGQYASVYIHVDPRILAVGSLVVFAFITTRGVQANAIVQNVMVVLLSVALYMYVFKGMPELNGELVSLSTIIAPRNVSIVAMGSAVTLLSGSLQGAITVAFYPDEIENPGKSIPRAFVLATAICCITFMLVSVVTIGILPMEKVDSLLLVAKEVLSNRQYHFFVCAGSIFAVLTSLNGIFVAGGHVGMSTAADKVTPAWMGKLNKKHAPANTVWMLAIIAIILVGGGFDIGTLLTAYSLLNLFALLLLFIPANTIHKKYPHSFKAASFKMKPAVTKVLSVFGIVFCIWQLISTLVTLDRQMIITIVVWYLAWYAFYFFRKKSLSSKGVDLDKVMSTPYPAWEEREKELAMAALKANEPVELDA